MRDAGGVGCEAPFAPVNFPSLAGGKWDFPSVGAMVCKEELLPHSLLPLGSMPVRARGASHISSPQKSLPGGELMDANELACLLMPFYESINSF